MSTLFRSKNEIVYEVLHTSIIHGEYEPGGRLVIDDLATKLGVSQIPIREALRQLEADGFVTIEPYVGATVTKMNAEFIFEIFALLEGLEVICSRTACITMSAEELAQLEALVQRMDACIHSWDEWSLLNKEFHILIGNFARTHLVNGMMRKVLDHWDRLRQRYFQDVRVQRFERAQAEHRLLMEAFHQRDADEVERLIRSHNKNALASYLVHLREAGILSKEGRES